MSSQKFLLSILITFGWGTALSLPIVQSQIAVAQQANAPTKEAANAQVTDVENRQRPETKKPETTPKAFNRRLILKLRERRVYVYEGDRVLAKYRVAIGKKSWETPSGNFKVIKMIRNPMWKNPWTGRISEPGSKSPLGERWIGFWTDGKNTIGFHGTSGEHLIGRAVSHGCVRMRNKDIKAMFDMVEIGTPVVVQP